MRTHMAWKVHTHMPRVPLGTSAARRSRISAAALLVNVMARICQGVTPRSPSMWAMRKVEHAGLARAGAGEHQQRALGGQDRLALSGIKAVDVDERLGRLGCRRGSVVDVKRNELGLRRGGGGVRIERHGFRRGRHGYRGVLFPGQGLGHGRLLI